MKKTVTANISGIAFTLDEDAYTLLYSYLNDIASRLSNNNEGRETMEDIESRIAEHFRNNGASNIRVVNIELVQKVIALIGTPEIFGEKRAGGGYEKTEYTHTPPPYIPTPLIRKLLRDPRNRVVGGVCSGLAAYFSADTLLIRVLMFILIWGAGVGLLFYILLWIFVPKAKTAEDFAILDEMQRRRL